MEKAVPVVAQHEPLIREPVPFAPTLRCPFVHKLFYLAFFLLILIDIVVSCVLLLYFWGNWLIDSAEPKVYKIRWLIIILFSSLFLIYSNRCHDVAHVLVLCIICGCMCLPTFFQMGLFFLTVKTELLKGFRWQWNLGQQADIALDRIVLLQDFF